MESRDLLGIDRYPMGAEQRADLEELFALAHARLTLLSRTVNKWDGKALPIEHAEFYAIGETIRAVERSMLAVMKHAGDTLLWDVETSRETRVKPRFPGMIPPSATRKS